MHQNGKTNERAGVLIKKRQIYINSKKWNYQLYSITNVRKEKLFQVIPKHICSLKTFKF